MPEIDPVILKLIADTKEYRSEINRAHSVTDQRLAGIEKRSVTMASTLTRSFAAARVAALGLLTGVSVIAFAKTLVTIGDEAKKLDAQLKLATAGFGTFAQAQEDAKRIADATRSDMSATVSLYANFIRASKELGATQSEAARATETFSKTLKISGADATQSASATLQFGQALAAGALRGDELNSILEASPRLARLLAEAMGQPIGQIKQLGQEGKLTSDKLLKALTDQKYTAGIDAEFKTLPLTVDDAMTKVQNASLAVFSAFDRGGQFSTMLANFIADGAEGFDDLVEAAENAGIEIRAIMEGLSGAFQPLRAAGGDLFDFLIGQSRGWGDVFRQEIHNTLQEFDQLSVAAANAQNLWIDFANKWDGLVNRLHGTNRPMRQRATPSDLAGEFQKNYDRSRSQAENDQRDREWQKLLSGFGITGDPVAGTAPRPPKLPKPASGGASKAKTARSPLDPDAFAREEAQLNSEILRLKSDEVTDATERARFEVERLEEQKRYAVESVNADKRYTDEQKKKIVALIETASALEQAKVARERDAALDREALDAKTSQIDNERDIIRAQLDLADTREDRHALELRLLELAHEQEEAELEAVLASKTATQAQKQIAEARLAILDRLKGAETERVNRDNESPLARYRRGIETTQKNMDDEIQNVAIDAMDRLADSTANAAAEYVKLGGIAGDVINGIIRDLVRLAVQQTIVNNLAGAISGIFGGGKSVAAPVMASAGNIRNVASGTDFAHGGIYRVGEAGPETVMLPRGAKVIPNTNMAAAGRNVTNVTQVLRFDLSNAVMTPDLLAQMNQMAQGAAVGGAMAGSNLAQSNMARRSRNRIP